MSGYGVNHINSDLFFVVLFVVPAHLQLRVKSSLFCFVIFLFILFF